MCSAFVSWMIVWMVTMVITCVDCLSLSSASFASSLLGCGWKLEYTASGGIRIASSYSIAHMWSFPSHLWIDSLSPTLILRVQCRLSVILFICTISRKMRHQFIHGWWENNFREGNRGVSIAVITIRKGAVRPYPIKVLFLTAALALQVCPSLTCLQQN